MDTQRFLSNQREVLRILAGVSASHDEALAEVLNRAVNIAGSLSEPIAQAAKQIPIADAISNAAPSAATATATASTFTTSQLTMNPDMAINTWKNLVSSLRTAVSVARQNLPWAGGVVIVAAAAAVAFHVATVSVPKWMRSQRKTKAASMKKSQMRNLTEEEILMQERERKVDMMLLEEVKALRAEVDLYRTAAASKLNLGTMVRTRGGGVDVPTTDDLGESMSDGAMDPIYHQHELLGLSLMEASVDENGNPTTATTLGLNQVRSLQAANIALRKSLAMLTAELQARVEKEALLTDEIFSLRKLAKEGDERVDELTGEVERLVLDREEQGKRIEAMEGNIEQLRS
ncbi:hypothetical protein HDU76_011277, partial [Blyttiomyces sp. JEL0837]